MFSLKSRLALAVVSLLIIGLVGGCAPTTGISYQTTFPVDSIFSDFYREIGGDNTLGPAISASFINNGLTYQYVVSGLMVYDANQPSLKRYYFSPLASVEWHINGLIEPTPQDKSIPYVNGHQVWEEVTSFFNQFGSDIIGIPVTGVTANDVKQRYEQYFEGLGFYRKYSDPPGQIHLMPYGHWMCGSNCPYQLTDATPPAGSYKHDNSETELVFLQASEHLGYGFTGAPLASPHLASDGFYQMVFENVILYLDPSTGNQIKLRPLPATLGIQTEPPGPEIKAAWLSFYPTQAGLGFNIPKSFFTYINAHGEMDVSGNPIGEFKNLSDGGYSQCFTNLCLEYHPTAPHELMIRPQTLGSEYLSMGESVSASGTQVTDALQINAWEDFPLIPSGQNQGINIEALQNRIPVSGIKFSLVVKQPDGISKTYTLLPTGEDGRTHIVLDPVNGPNGAIVQYEICVLAETNPQICFSRSYTIWEQQ